MTDLAAAPAPVSVTPAEAQTQPSNVWIDGVNCPPDLGVGDLIRVRMYNETFGRTITRNSLVTGIICDPYGNPTALTVMRLAALIRDNRETDIMLSGMALADMPFPSKLRGDRIDVIPFDARLLGGEIQRIGRLRDAEQNLHDIADDLEAFKERGVLDVPPAAPHGRESYAASLNSGAALDTIALRFADILGVPPEDDYTRAQRAVFAQMRAQAASAAASYRANNPYLPQQDAYGITPMPESAFAGMARAEIKAVHISPTDTAEPAPKKPSRSRLAWDMVCAARAKKAASPSPAFLPPQGALGPATFALGDVLAGAMSQPLPEKAPKPVVAPPKADRRRPKAAKVFTATAKDVAATAYTPNFARRPGPGDIVVAHINDISDPENSKFAQRPCIVYRTYDDADGNLVGMDVLACTRMQARRFQDVLEVPSPFNKRVYNGTHVIFDRLVRLPVNGRYFQEENKVVAPYPARLTAEILTRRALFENANPEYAVFGQQDIPAEWTAVNEASIDPAAVEGESVVAPPTPAITCEVKPGDIVMTHYTDADGQERGQPAVVWGVWRHTLKPDTIMAVDLMKIHYAQDEKRNPWQIHWTPSDGANPALTLDGGMIDARTVTLTPNTERGLMGGATREDVVIDRVPDDMMDRLTRLRGNALFHCKFRPGWQPRFLPHHWERASGPQYKTKIGTIADKAQFAPDVPAYREPGRIDRKSLRAQLG